MPLARSPYLTVPDERDLLAEGEQFDPEIYAPKPPPAPPAPVAPPPKPQGGVQTAPKRTYAPEVEKWRPEVSKYDWDADKALYVISGESGGSTSIRGDGGLAKGGFQSHYEPGDTIEEQVADAYRLYKADKAAGGTGFGDWGEGRTYQGKKFGALGHNPYPGTAAEGVTITNRPMTQEETQRGGVMVEVERLAKAGKLDQAAKLAKENGIDAEGRGFWKSVLGEKVGGQAARATPDWLKDAYGKVGNLAELTPPGAVLAAKSMTTVDPVESPKPSGVIA